MRNLKIVGLAVLVSIAFEYFFNILIEDLDLQKSLYSFIFHSLVLIVAIFLAINFLNSSFSRIQNFKIGLFISILFSIFISGYYYSYHKWINPKLLENKRSSLIYLTEKHETFFDAKHKIQKNPNYYKDKSVEDLIEMQQDNINDLLQPAKVFPISLFSFLFTGMIFTILIGFLKYHFKNLY